MDAYIRIFDDWEPPRLALWGGKGKSLAELSQAGFPVPHGFVITTTAYREAIRRDAVFQGYLDALDRLLPGEWEERRRLGEAMRRHLRALTPSAALCRAVREALATLPEGVGVAVRSSATAEDLPHASFAGQQDSFLNVQGEAAVFAAICDCWASLFSDRAMAYRVRYAIAPREVEIAVIVQEMVPAEVSGVLFSADPQTGNRDEALISAVPGLGEPLVQGRERGDLYRVHRDGRVEREIAEKGAAVYAKAAGGLEERPLGERARQACLIDEEALALARLGRFVAKVQDGPQDIEWCLADGQFWIVQARPVTTLYPLPRPRGLAPHLYLSAGHIQQYTDAMPPLALSVLEHALPFLRSAGSRPYADIGGAIGHPLLRRHLPGLLMRMDPSLGRDLALALRESPDHYPLRRPPLPLFITLSKAFAKTARTYAFARPERLRRQTIARSQWLIARERARLEAQPTPAGEMAALKRLPATLLEIAPVWVASEIAHQELDRLLRRLGENPREALRILAQAHPDHLTVEMGLALGDLADMARTNKAVMWFLRQPPQTDFMARLAELPGADAFYKAFAAFLDRYGLHVAGEFNLSLPRWQDAPWLLAPMIVAQTSGRKPGAHRARHAAQAAEAQALARRLRRTALRRGPLFALRLSRALALYRGLGGLRDHHKYLLLSQWAIYHRRFTALGETLHAAGLLAKPRDIFFLRLEELDHADTLAPEPLARELRRRKNAFAADRRRIPPRVMLGNGTILRAKAPDSHAPSGALTGVTGSPGIASGRARIVFDPVTVQLAPGDILVCPTTDPAWTPLFHHIAGLVTETGGLMSHGAVVARELGLPAVLAVPGATARIHEGDRILVNANEGWVDLLHD